MCEGAGGGGRVAFVWVFGGCDCEVGDALGRGPLGPLGYCRVAAPAAAREALDPEAPIVFFFVWWFGAVVLCKMRGKDVVFCVVVVAQ